MSNWEYKLISSGPLGFASLPLLEQHLNQLGKEEWEIVSFTSKPDNPLVFHGLARRPVVRDWFPPPAAKPAASAPVSPEEDDGRDERTIADELPPARPGAAGLGDFDSLGGSEEDLPTLFEALRPHLRKTGRGELTVGLDYLAKKFEQDEGELLAAFAECGLEQPRGAGLKGGVVQHDNSQYWLETDRKGRVWLNMRDRKFKAAPTAAVADEPAPPSRPARQESAPAKQISAPDSFLGKIRAHMRRNRRGQGWSGSFGYLTKALQLDETQLLVQLGDLGLRLPESESQQPVFATEDGILYWLNKNQRGETWINAREARPDESRPSVASPAASEAVSAPAATPSPENTLAAVRLLLQPKKRGEGVAAPVTEIARQLEKSEEQLRAALAAAGLVLPADPKGKPGFAAHGGEVFWLNRNSRDEVWLNAKPQSAVKRSRSRGKPAAGT